MTNVNTIDINTFCALPIHIEAIADTDGNEWFVLDKQLWKLLELHEDARCHQLLHPKEWTFQVLEHCDGARREVDLISEVGLYMLLLVSKAQAVQPFKSWVLDVVAPTLAEDSLYVMGEETLFHAPTGYDLTHDEVWSGDMDGAGSAYELATLYLPMLRQKGTTEMIAYIIDTADGRSIGLPNYTSAIQRKNERKRTHHCAA